MNHRTILWTLVLFGSVTAAHGQAPGNIFQATLGESEQRTAEVSTEDLKAILADNGAVLLDTRPSREFAISHIPGAVNLDSATFYDAKANRLKPQAELAGLASNAVPVGPTVTYCNTGHWASTDWFVTSVS